MRASAYSEPQHKARRQSVRGVPLHINSCIDSAHAHALALSGRWRRASASLHAWLRPLRLQELSLGGNAIGDAGAHHIGNPTRPVGA